MSPQYRVARRWVGSDAGVLRSRGVSGEVRFNDPTEYFTSQLVDENY